MFKDYGALSNDDLTQEDWNLANHLAACATIAVKLGIRVIEVSMNGDGRLILDDKWKAEDRACALVAGMIAEETHGNREWDNIQTAWSQHVSEIRALLGELVEPVSEERWDLAVERAEKLWAINGPASDEVALALLRENTLNHYGVLRAIEEGEKALADGELDYFTEEGLETAEARVAALGYSTPDLPVL